MHVHTHLVRDECEYTAKHFDKHSGNTDGLDRHRLGHAQRPARLSNAPQLEARASKQPLVLLPRALAPVRLHHLRSQRAAMSYCPCTVASQKGCAPCHALKDLLRVLLRGLPDGRADNASSWTHAEHLTSSIIAADGNEICW